MDAETRAYLDKALGIVRDDFAGLRGEVVELRTEVRETAVETRRHFDVTAEALRYGIQVVAEGVALNTEQIERLRTEMDSRFAAVDNAFIHVRRDIHQLRRKS